LGIVTDEEITMGSRKGMRAQESQANTDQELSGAGAGFREPDSRDPATRRDPDTGRRSIEEPPEDDSRSTLAPERSDESDDIPSFEDDDEDVDEENDLA
jgi:hypothetical protein